MNGTFLLSGRTAGDLRRVLDRVPATLGPDQPAAPVGEYWVLVTGAAVSGWHPGTVVRYAGTTQQAYTTGAKVRSMSGDPLRSGVIYPCQRTGDDGSDNPQFLTPVYEYTLDIPDSWEPSEADPCVMVPATVKTLTISGVGLFAQLV